MKFAESGTTDQIVDNFESAWVSERPDLDPAAVATDLRLNMTAQLFSERCSEALTEHGFEWWEYDVLSRLRREGAPYQCTVQELADILPVSSGALTNRLDKLEKRRLVSRSLDTSDRRRVIVTLKPSGLKRVDKAAEARFLAASRTLSVLSASEQRRLNNILDKLIEANR